MYSLIVTAEIGAWERRSYAISSDRFVEHTAEALRTRYQGLSEDAVAEIKSFPALLAYETPHSLPARVARITRITEGSDRSVRFHYGLLSEIAPIEAAQLSEMAFDLDIGRWELNRTHWAIKDIDLWEVLEDAGVITADIAQHWESQTRAEPPPGAPSSLLVQPTVFAIPTVARDPRLVAVMMPFSSDFGSVYDAIRAACTAAGLRCERADDVWEESTIIQDIFNLIYRSAVVIVDLSGRSSNVMYETGIAHTLGRPVVPISNRTDNLPFDLAHHRTLGYLPNEQGLSELKEKLARRLHRLTDTIS